MGYVDGWYWFPGNRGAIKLEVTVDSVRVNLTDRWQGHVRESGRRGPLDRFLASTLTFDLDNRDGELSPWRTGSVVGKPGRNMLVRLTAKTATGFERVRFYGWTDEWRETAEPGVQGVAYPRIRVTATDGFKRLARGNGIPQVSAGAGELTGARIHRILDAAGWYEDLRAVDDGQVTMAATTLERPALDELHDTALSEGGYLFMSEAGYLTFYDRATVEADWVPIARFGNDGGSGSIPYTTLGSAASAAGVVNTVRIAKQGGTEYVAVDSASVADEGPILFTRTDLGHDSDADSDDLAALLLGRAVAAVFAVGTWEVEPVTGGDLAWEGCVTLGLTDPVALAHYNQIVGEGFTHTARIDSITERCVPGRWTSTFLTSPVDAPGTFEVIGPPTGMAATVGYDWISWSWVIPAHGYDTVWVSLDGDVFHSFAGDTSAYYAGGLEPGSTHTLCVRGRKGLVDTEEVCLSATTNTAPGPPDPEEGGGSVIPPVPEDCVAPHGWAWRLEELSPTMGVTFLDDGLSSAYLEPTVWRPEYDYVPTTWYRLTWQLYCDGAPEGDQIVYDWQEPADWLDACDWPTPGTPTPTFALEVCAATAEIRDIVSDVRLFQGALFKSARPGPFETDVGIFCAAGFQPAPVASGYLDDTANMGVVLPIPIIGGLLQPEITIGCWVNLDSEPLTIFPLVGLGQDARNFGLMLGPDTSVVGKARVTVHTIPQVGAEIQWQFDVMGDEVASITLAEWHSIVVTWGWEGTEAKGRLYIDGLEVANIDLDGEDWELREHSSLVTWYGEPNSSTAHAMGWNQILTAAEIEGIFTPPSGANYDAVVIADEPLAYWKLDAIDTVAGSDYDVTIITAVPKLFVKLDQFDTYTPPTTNYATEVLADSPWAYWKLDDSTTTATDASGNARHGTYTGSYIPVDLFHPAGTYARSWLSGAYVSAPNFPSTGTFTFEAWIWRDVDTESQLVGVWGSGGAAQSMILGSNTGGVIEFYTHPSAYTGINYSLALSGWHHIAGTLSGGTGRIYLNGTQVSSGSMGTSPANSGNTEIGRKGANSSLTINGHIAHVAIYPTALSAARLLAHYNAATA